MSDPCGGAGVSRRRALLLAPAAVLSAVGLAACTDDEAPPAPPAPVDPDDALRASAVERERALLRSYDELIAAVPALADRLRPLRGHHDEHLVALLGPPDSPSAEPSTDGSRSQAPEAGATEDQAPPAAGPRPSRAAALQRLSAEERATGEAHAADCLHASRSLAGVLASLSASELSHPVALR